MSEQPAAKELFERAVNIDPKEWDAWLDTECGANAELRRHVQELLNAYGRESDFLSSSPNLAAEIPSTRPESVRDALPQRTGRPLHIA